MYNPRLWLLIFIVQTTSSVRTIDYLINTSKCRIPDYKPFNYETAPIHKFLQYYKCSNLEPLTYTEVVNNIATLYIDTKVLLQYYQSDLIRCCYSHVYRNTSMYDPDVGIRFEPCHHFPNKIQLTHSIVYVRCANWSHVVYENVHSPILKTENVKEKIRRLARKNLKPISVLLVVVDSVSQQNLQRTMPRTFKYLTENNFVNFKGYNKVDMNTFPNFMALLTGLNLAQSQRLCNPRMIMALDKCPMIWYKYRQLGYVTAYAEDWANLNTFNYNKAGFSNPPTDYYFKPYFEATDNNLTVVIQSTMPYCTGPETAGERVLNLAKDFAFTFRNQASFGVFWMNTFSHNEVNAPSRMDESLEKFFQKLNLGGVLNDSVVMFFSDHGVRFGEIVTTTAGWFEERQPFNLISVPRWFQLTYPKEYRNFLRNSQKLTSTYDLYETLQDILVLSELNYTRKPSRACPDCQSFFQEIPTERSCASAGIPEEWCSCTGFITIIPIGDYLRRESRKVLEKELGDVPYDFLRAGISEIVENYRYLFLLIRTIYGKVYTAQIRLNRDLMEFVGLTQHAV